MASTAKTQEMPPPGGYRPVNFARNPAKQYFSGYTMFLGFAGMTSLAIYVYYLTCKKVKREEIEMRSSRIALMPMLLAERDRQFLLQLRRNRDEEADLMKNVEGWEVGKYYGDPIYKTLPPDTLVEPEPKEYYVHSSYKEYAKRVFFNSWT